MDAELFANPDILFGLEVKEPWAGMILNNQKTVETRTYSLPEPLIGRPIVLLATAADSGTAGTSGLADSSPPGACTVVGLVTFGEIVRWESREAWEVGSAHLHTAFTSPDVASSLGFVLSLVTDVRSTLAPPLSDACDESRVRASRVCVT